MLTRHKSIISAILLVLLAEAAPGKRQKWSPLGALTRLWGIIAVGAQENLPIETTPNLSQVVYGPKLVEPRVYQLVEPTAYYAGRSLTVSPECVGILNEYDLKRSHSAGVDRLIRGCKWATDKTGTVFKRPKPCSESEVYYHNEGDFSGKKGEGSDRRYSKGGYEFCIPKERSHWEVYEGLLTQMEQANLIKVIEISYEELIKGDTSRIAAESDVGRKLTSVAETFHRKPLELTFIGIREYREDKGFPETLTGFPCHFDVAGIESLSQVDNHVSMSLLLPVNRGGTCVQGKYSEVDTDCDAYNNDQTGCLTAGNRPYFGDCDWIGDPVTDQPVPVAAPQQPTEPQPHYASSGYSGVTETRHPETGSAPHPNATMRTPVVAVGRGFEGGHLVMDCKPDETANELRKYKGNNIVLRNVGDAVFWDGPHTAHGLAPMLPVENTDGTQSPPIRKVALALFEIKEEAVTEGTDL